MKTLAAIQALPEELEGGGFTTTWSEPIAPTALTLTPVPRRGDDLDDDEDDEEDEDDDDDDFDDEPWEEVDDERPGRRRRRR